MGQYSNYYFNNTMPYRAYSPSFRGEPAPAPLAKPIEKVENIVNNTVDNFVFEQPKSEEQKKKRHTAVKVLSSGLVLGSFLLLLNPKSINKFLDKFQKWSAQAGNDQTIKGKIYKFFNGVSKGLTMVMSNGNSLKDELFTNMCTKKKNFSRIKNDFLRSIAEKIDSGFVYLMNKPHKAITKGFDYLGKKTVYRKYSNVASEMDLLDQLLISYKNKLSPKELKAFETRLSELRKAQMHFSKKSVEARLLNQEKIMSELETQFASKRSSYFDSFKVRPMHTSTWNSSNFKADAKHINDNLYFWAQDIMMPKRNIIEQEGKKAVNALMGDGVKSKGAYQELLEIISPHMGKEEKALIEDSMQKISTNLRKANKSECIEYFDKKRDLVLGSAPTDILTVLIGLGASGIAVGKADTKDERISNTVTMTLPVLAGLGVNMLLTSMLFSGPTGLALGSIAGLGFNKLGNLADKHLIPKSENKEKKIYA